MQPLAHIPNLHAYVPGEQPQGDGWVKLNTNELPYPPSPRVREAILREVGEDGARLRLYPEPLSKQLRTAIAAYHGLESSQVIVGNGSDDVLNLIVRAYCDATHPAASFVPSYSLYPVLLGIQNGQWLEIPLDEQMQLDPQQAALTEASVLFITSPNAPTGVGYTLDTLRAIAKAAKGLVVIDEAYVAFAKEDATPLLKEFSNVVITRTFSKAYGLAGMRVGYALAAPEVIDMLDRVRDSYNLDRLAQVAALAALEDRAWLEQTVNRVKATRDATAQALTEQGWTVYPSQTNFLFAQPLDGAGQRGAAVAASVFESLKAQRVLVRYFPKHPFTCSFLRITIGTDEQMGKFLNAIQTWRKQEPQK